MAGYFTCFQHFMCGGIRNRHSSAPATFLFGFGIGALVTSPFSETFGRNLDFIVTMGLMMICLGLSSCADTLAQQLVFRLFAGFLGSSPLVCAGGSLSDLWTSHKRIYVFPVFAVISYTGSAVAPVVGGAIYRGGASWRWGDWITIIATGLLLFMVIVVLPETFQPILHKAKTRIMQAETRHRHAHIFAIDTRGKSSLWYQIMQAIWRPFVVTADEAILVLFTWYITLIYVILLTFLNGFNYIFADIYGFDPVQKRDLDNVRGRGRKYNDDRAIRPKSNGNSDLSAEAQHAEDVDVDIDALAPPLESQLYYAMVGAPFIPVSLFWMAYTSRADISPWSPIAAFMFFGFSFTTVFASCYQYLTACYGIWSASAGPGGSQLSTSIAFRWHDDGQYGNVFEYWCYVVAYNLGGCVGHYGAGAVCFL
ncbi:major facilitator superfamily domain-containing protein [Aspergillus undulatus]|uniref:major facilitator superfamily domain-containing protein n=1 Tax=Aspergillus undulatus TaxID=1810928 RepID=UPI003CCD6C55